ncbi:hypothetical protein CWI38_0964p0050 [Hamiltosporidium tvaerminnensis]|uniref:Uncharacterized protein n=2 Tax=Hamiltosporidium TaxID=1176354 RepID=A0A4Q9LJP4_9MICR|nr:hypothetical protein LUQ84_002936 [Hamiltosporidium tvaerminnensis]TBU05163.1 hypothetical protein CWI37_0043p0080 [Hamiltosporidium tvaerminnensis]TBU07246.1 hypothetical protein CWI39_0346p0050 [Hamiltosporidium magnivora]TBU07735.1 hypothetical protein CWI36_0234p0040 [Hamiltosporidium magnivora]TBU11959.1 hypothetical protein CWI38_0964p0050 [Hamiltosporidium tvaerminnensis]
MLLLYLIARYILCEDSNIEIDKSNILSNFGNMLRAGIHKKYGLDMFKGEKIGMYTSQPSAAANPAPGCYIVYQNQNPQYPTQMCPGMPGYNPAYAYQNPSVPTAPNNYNSTTTVTQQPAVKSTSTNPPQTVQVAPSNPNATKKVTKVSVSSKPEQTELEKFIEKNPEVGKQLAKIFEYNGIMEPWDPVKDLLDLKQQRLPDPHTLYDRIRNMLKVFETLKELISDELVKIEIYVKRAKTYYKEDHDTLARNLAKLKKYMNKIKESHNHEVKTDYASKFNEVQNETNELMKRSQKLKQWLTTTLQSFKQLF